MSHIHAHAHTHGHSHSHDHSFDVRGRNKRRLALVLVLVVIYMIAEVIGGLLSNSLALLADAGHMLSDAAALALSFFAVWVADRPTSSQKTYGLYRTEILAALVNGAALIAIAVFICVEAFKRFSQPQEVHGQLMMTVAVGGLIINLIGLWILHDGKDESLNVRGAWLHVMADALGSVGAIIAGALILAFGWFWVDAAASVVIALLVVYSGWGLLRETVAVLMEAAPGHIDVDEVRTTMLKIPGIQSVHDLHIWSITSGMVSLSAHVVAEDTRRTGAILSRIRDRLRDSFNIGHITIQVEPEGFKNCEGCD